MQPYKKCYMNVLDSLLLALLGFLILLIFAIQFLLPSSDEALPLIVVTACAVPQVVLLLSVTYRQLKGKRIVRFIASKVSTLLKQIHTRNQAADELSDPICCPIDWLVPTSTAGLCCQYLSEHMPTLKHFQYQDKYHPCTLMAQSAREMNPQTVQ